MSCSRTQRSDPVEAQTRAGRYYRDTGISRYFISVIRIVIMFGRIAISSSLLIVTISCWNLS